MYSDQTNPNKKLKMEHVQPGSTSNIPRAATEGYGFRQKNAQRKKKKFFFRHRNDFFKNSSKRMKRSTILDETITDVEKAIMNKLAEDAIWDFCFDIHRSVKLNYSYFYLDEEEKIVVPEIKHTVEVENSNKEAKEPIVNCRSCGKKTGLNRYLTHLERCRKTEADKRYYDNDDYSQEISDDSCSYFLREDDVQHEDLY